MCPKQVSQWIRSVCSHRCSLNICIKTTIIYMIWNRSMHMWTTNIAYCCVRTPFDDAIVPDLRGSSSQAALNARANALKVASTI